MATLTKGLDTNLSRTARILLTAVCVLMSTIASAERTLYVTNAAGNVATFVMDSSDGTLRLADVVNGIGAAVRGIAITPDGRSAYVVDSTASTVVAFAIDEHGLLKQIGVPVETDPNAKGPFQECGVEEGARTTSSPCAFGPRGLAVSPDGRRLYVALGDDDAIALFGIEPNRAPIFGESVQVGGCTQPATNPAAGRCSPMWMSITPDGHWLYSTNMEGGDLSTFAIEAQGRLNAVGPHVPTGGRPERIAITPDTRFLYVNVEDENAVKSFAIGANGHSVFWIHPPRATISGRPPRVAQSLPCSRRIARRSVSGTRDSPNQGPSASLAPARGVVNDTIAFDATASADSDGRVDHYDWDFGDGRIVADAGPKPPMSM